MDVPVEHMCQRIPDDPDTARCAGAAASGIKGGISIDPAPVHDLSPDATSAGDEVFAPVLTVLKCQDIDGAVSIANDTVVRSAASVGSGDIDGVHRTGTVWSGTRINSAPVTPCGTIKQGATGRGRSRYASAN